MAQTVLHLPLVLVVHSTPAARAWLPTLTRTPSRVVRGVLIAQRVENASNQPRPAARHIPANRLNKSNSK